MDLQSLADAFEPEEAFVVHLTGPDGEALYNDDEKTDPMTISVLGQDSDVVVKARNAAVNKRLKAESDTVTIEGAEPDAIHQLAVATVGWNITMNKGSKLPFSYEAAKALYGNKQLPFIREKVSKALQNRANFLKASPTS